MVWRVSAKCFLCGFTKNQLIHTDHFSSDMMVPFLFDRRESESGMPNILL